VYCFARFYDHEIIIVALNRGPATQIQCNAALVGLDPNATMYDALSNTQIQANDGILEISLPAHSAYVLRNQKSEQLCQ